ncbi:MAG: hypothetical protein IJX72_04100 [Clostridia bacterium]|nr:hypothetical protein [Clostridia bacterium]
MSNENLNEKVSVNINTSTLSQIDLLVDNGYYSNRSDFINQAVRELLGKERSVIDGIIERNSHPKHRENSWFIGVSGLTAKDIDAMYQAGERIRVTGYGVLTIDSGCDEEKLYATVESIKIKGKVYCSNTIKAHYGLK